MDDTIDLAEYLPVYFKAPSEQECIAFLWATFEENYNNARYQFAFLAYHMLMMSYVYFNIWQLRQTRPSDFEKGLIGFPKESERTLLIDVSPFTFSVVSESLILRLLRLTGCDDSNIGQYVKLVRDRNKAAHANGDIFLKTQSEAESQILEVLRAVEEIHAYSRPIIDQCYQEFLLQSYKPDEREYLDTDDQIREVLIHGNYMSPKDIELCANFDTASLPHDNKQAIENLHSTLREVYATSLED